MSYISFDLYPPHGIGNKLAKWSVMYRIAEINDFQIMLNWPELDYMELPRTIKGDILLQSKKLALFDSKELEDNINYFELSKNYNWISNDFGNYTNVFEEQNRINCPYREIKFPIFEKYFCKNEIKEFVGIHIRQGDYQLSNNPNFLGGFKNKDNFDDGGFFRTPNSWYKQCIENILKEKPDTMFYLSSNAERLTPVTEELNKEKITTVNSFSPGQDDDFKRCFDLWALSKCKALLGSHSTFSHFAALYGNIPLILPHEWNQDMSNVISLL